MYPGGNNYNNQFPNQQPGFNVPPQSGYQNYPQAPSYGVAPIGFNVGQPDYNQSQGFPSTYGQNPAPSYPGYNQPPNVAPYLPSAGNTQEYYGSQPSYNTHQGGPISAGNQPYQQGGPMSTGNQPYQQGGPMSTGNQSYQQGGPMSTGNQPYQQGGPMSTGNQPYQQVPPKCAGNQSYQQGGAHEYPGQAGGYQATYPTIPPQAGASNWSQGAIGQQLPHSQPLNSNFTPISYGQNFGQQVNVENIGSAGEIYRGTIKPSPNFNAEHDCNVLKKAMKGIGTDEKAIIECLGRRCIAQRLEIKKTFKTMFGKDLIDELKSELSGDFSRSVIESLYDPDYYDAYCLRKAMEGAGTRENVLTEILTSRSNQQIENIKMLYKKWYNRDLEKDVVSETSGFYKRVLVSCLQANKKELTNDEIIRIKQGQFASILNINQARQEAQELYNAGEKKIGTDEACFIKIFALRNKYQLRATFDEYLKLTGRDIFASIDREMSGDLASALKAIAMQAVNSPLYFATRLYKAMKGAGTNDTTLVRVLLTRSEVDLENIKMEFQKQNGKSLDHFVRGDTSGDYQKYLIRFVEGN